MKSIITLFFAVILVTLSAAPGNIYLPVIIHAAATPTMNPTLTPAPTDTPTPTSTQPPAPTPTYTPTATQRPAAPCDCYGPDLNCTDFSTHTSAQACFNFCWSLGLGDVFGLDSDGDGVACESLPGQASKSSFDLLGW